MPLQIGMIPVARRYFRQSIHPVLVEQAGFVEAQFLSDSSTHQALLVSFWASEADRQKSLFSTELELQQLQVYFAGQPSVSDCEVNELRS